MRYLEAIERDQFDRLPGGVFDRGYVRAYAAAVGLDPEATVEAYVVQSRGAAAPDDDATLDALRTVVAARSRRASSRGRPARRIALVALVCGLLGAPATWIVTHRDGPPARGGIEARVVIDRPVSGTLNCDDRRVEVLDGLRAGTTLELGCGRFLILTADDGGALRIGVDGATPVPPADDGEPVLGLRLTS